MGILTLNIAAPIFVLGIMCTITEGFVTTIDVTITAEGNILKTGIREYFLYGSHTKSFTIKCELNTAVQPSQVSILRYNYTTHQEEMQTIRQSRLRTSKWETTVNRNNLTDGVQYKYTCRASFSVICCLTLNENQCHSVIDSDVEISLGTSSRIVSNIGFNVYLGEEMSIECSDEVVDSCKANDSEILRERNIIVSNETSNFKCMRFSGPSLCSTPSPKFDIKPNLKLLLKPSNFSSNVTTLHFTCTSVPPRLMRWIIITDSGDIIDFRSADDIIEVSMNVTMTQKSGETALNINEESAGGNKILSVICSSYDTPAQAFASSQRVFIEEYNDGDAVTTIPSTVTVSSTSSAIMSTGMPTRRTSDTYQSFQTTEKQPTESKPTENTNQPNVQNREYDKQNFKSWSESIYFKFVLLLVTTLAFFVCLLIVVVVVLIRKLRLAVVRANSSTTCNKNDEEPMETILHDNPVYLPFSEIGYSQDEALQDDIDAYANLENTNLPNLQYHS